MTTSIDNSVDPSRGRTRYARLSHASLILIPKVLQEVLAYYEPPKYILQDCFKIFQIFNLTEKAQIKHAEQNGYNDFDISLIYKVMRNLDKQNIIINPPFHARPTKGWDHPDDPGGRDLTVGDDLIRCRKFRNTIIHRGNSNITEKELKSSFKLFYDIARRLEKILGKRNKEFVSQFESLEICCMDDAKAMEYLEEVERHKKKINLLQDQLEHLTITNKEEVELIPCKPDLKCVEGERVALECLMAGSNKTAEWSKGDDILPPDVIVESKGPTLKLIISKVSKIHDGTYTVKISGATCSLGLKVIERQSSFKLRNYQHELAEFALTGENNIVCAGTNAGKTHVAFYVIENHLLKNPAGKVVFINGTNVLLEQQYRRACEILESLNKQEKIYKWEAGKDFDKDFLERLQKTSLLFLTPKSLSNHLGEDVANKILIDDLTLIVFDECHHTYSKDLYNELMSYYRIQKLPQIVGLTASPGTNRAQHEDSAVLHLKTLMANLSVSRLSVVLRNEEDLLKYSSTPEKISISSKAREDDPIKKILLEAIESVEKIFISKRVLDFLFQHNAKTAGLTLALRKVPFDKTDSRYIQWMAETKEKIEKVHHKDREVTRLLHACIRHLELYAECLEVNSLLDKDQVQDAFQEGYGTLLFEGQMATTEEEKMLMSKLKDVHGEIGKLGKDFEGNPDIDEIIKYLENEHEKLKEESRFLIFVKTRATAKALAERLPDYLKATHLTGSHASKAEGGVPIKEQLDVVDKFKNGEHFCIVATTVACEGLDIQQCNLMIRYKFHADEISSLQMRGRIRQKEGKEILLASKVDLEREIQNLERQCLMKKAIDRVIKYDQGNMVREIGLIERQVYDTEEAQQRKLKMKIDNKKKGEFLVKCKKCGNLIVHGRCIRHIKKKHYIICDKNFLQRVERQPTQKKMKTFDGVKKQDKVYGKECRHNWGSVLDYRKCKFVSLSQDYINFFDVKKDEVIECKKWSDLPFFVDEISNDDVNLNNEEIQNHL